jgi:uncharacterized protein YecT (DUF1311 family)
MRKNVNRILRRFRTSLLLVACIGGAMQTTLLHPAHAQTEAFAGTWRIVKMERASWLPASKPPAHLLRSGVIIGDGKIIALPALACEKAEFTEEQLSQSDAFGYAGKKPIPRRYIKPFGHSEGGVITLRANCGERKFDYHQGTFNEIYLLHENHVLMLRKESASAENKKVNTEQRNASFDCTRAKTRIERMICEWPDALIADGDMGEVFRRLQKELAKPAAEALLRSQRAFNAYVEKICEVGNILNQHGHNLESTANCVAGHTRTRADFLAALNVETAGALRIEPMITTQTRIRGRENDISGWITNDAIPVLSGAAKPIADAFAAEVRRIFRAEKPLIRDRNDLNGAVTRTYRVGFINENFVSLSSLEHVDAGTSVPPYEVGLNFDLKSGRIVKLPDIFDMSDGWRNTVVEALSKGLNEPARFDEFRDRILRGEEAVWRFGKDNVEVSWHTGGIGPPEQTEIDAAILAPFVKSGSPWRP